VWVDGRGCEDWVLDGLASGGKDSKGGNWLDCIRGEGVKALWRAGAARVCLCQTLRGGEAGFIRKHDHFMPTREIRRHVRALAHNHLREKASVLPIETKMASVYRGTSLIRNSPLPGPP
jgi:hypothetical protein